METWDTDESAQRTPVTVLTGFLGSGKTTLLNGLLSDPALSGTVVIVNEFGEVGLDHLLLEEVTDDMVLLSNGCVCCSVRGELVEAFLSLVERKADGRLAAMDRVVIETTGLADPAPILHSLMADPFTGRHYRLDGVVATVDAVNGSATIEAHGEAARQVAVADRIVLTKTDIAPSDATERTLAAIRGRNPAAPVLYAVAGEADAASLFEAGLYDHARRTVDVERWLAVDAYEPDRHDHHAHDVNVHSDEIRAFCMTVDEAIPGEAFENWLNLAIMLKGPDLLRVKGIVNVEGMDGPVVIHGVQHVFHPPVFLDAWPGEDRRTRIVFITRGVEPRFVEGLFDTFRQRLETMPA